MMFRHKPKRKALRQFASAADLRAEWLQLIAAPHAPNMPVPVHHVQTPARSARPVLTRPVLAGSLPAETPAHYYTDPVQVVPQTVSWQGIVLEWPYYDEQCATPWGGENTMAASELTDGWR